MTKNLRQQEKKKDSVETQNRFFSRRKMIEAGEKSNRKSALFFKALNKPGSPDIGNRM